MTTNNPYLSLNGTCEEAFKFYRSIFRGEFPYVGKFKDMPENPEFSIPESEKEKIMHISLPIGGDTILMGSDSSDAFGQATIQGNNFCISINTDSVDEAFRVFSELAEKGEVKMSLTERFWQSYYSQLTDKFGIHWMVNFTLEGHKKNN